jgi:hypothetical protein
MGWEKNEPEMEKVLRRGEKYVRWRAWEKRRERKINIEWVYRLGSKFGGLESVSGRAHEGYIRDSGRMPGQSMHKQQTRATCRDT